MDKLPTMLCTFMDMLLHNNKLISWRISGENSVILSLKFDQGNEVLHGNQYFKAKSVGSIQRDKQRQQQYWDSIQCAGGYRQGGYEQESVTEEYNADIGNSHKGESVTGKDQTLLDSGLVNTTTFSPPMNTKPTSSTPLSHSQSTCTSTDFVDTGINTLCSSVHVVTMDAQSGPDNMPINNYTQSEPIDVKNVKFQTDRPEGKEKGNMTKPIRYMADHCQTDSKELCHASCDTDFLKGEHKHTMTVHPSRHVQTLSKQTKVKSTMTISATKATDTGDSPDQQDTLPLPESYLACSPSSTHAVSTNSIQEYNHCESTMHTLDLSDQKLSHEPQQMTTTAFMSLLDAAATTAVNNITDSQADSISKFKAARNRQTERIAFYKSQSGVT
jgi:hypothetical protein